MKSLKLFALALVAVTMFMFSCKMSTEKSKQKLEDATRNTVDQINMLQSTEFGNAVYGLLNVGVPNITTKTVSINKENIDKIKNIGINVRNIITNRFPGVFSQKLGSSQFSLTDIAGTYTYKFADSSWTKTATPTNQVIIIFPSKNSTTNDCKFVWSKYSETKCNDGYYYPTVIYAELFKDDNSIGLIDLTVTYNTATAIPSAANLVFGLSPLKIKADYTFENKMLTLNTTLLKNGRALDDLNLQLVFADDTLNKLNTGNGEFKTYNVDNAVNLSALLKIKFDFDATTAISSSADFNNKVNVKFYASSDRYIGKLQADDSSNCVFVILFDDGTTQCAQVYLNELSTAIQNAVQYSK